jgi:hypothetical protein
MSKHARHVKLALASLGLMAAACSTGETDDLADGIGGSPNAGGATNTGGTGGGIVNPTPVW